MDKLEIAKYVTAYLYGISPTIVKSYTIKNIIETIYYNNLGNIVESIFKIEKNKVVWGIKDGRWRNHSNDSVITYEINKNTIRITEKHFKSGVQMQEFKVK